jgi:hypothetical protein
MSKPIEKMFIYSHLVAIVDPLTFGLSPASEKSDQSIQRTLTS